jgi:hypothetical protein
VFAVRGERRPGVRISVARAIAEDERREVVLARTAARGLEVVPQRACAGGEAIVEVRVAVQCLAVGPRPAGCELTEQLDVRGLLDAGEHLDDLVAVSFMRELSVVVGHRVVDEAEPAAGGARIELAAPLDVAPEGDDVPAAGVRPRIDGLCRWDDRRTCPRRVSGDRQLPDHVHRLRACRERDPTRDARDEGMRAQVEQHVPRVPQDDRLVAAHALFARHRECGGNRTP